MHVVETLHNRDCMAHYATALVKIETSAILHLSTTRSAAQQ